MTATYSISAETGSTASTMSLVSIEDVPDTIPEPVEEGWETVKRPWEPSSAAEPTMETDSADKSLSSSWSSGRTAVEPSQPIDPQHADSVEAVTDAKTKSVDDSAVETDAPEPCQSRTETRCRRRTIPDGRSSYYGTMEYYAQKLYVDEILLDDWLQGKTDLATDAAIWARLNARPEHRRYLTMIRSELTTNTELPLAVHMGVLFDHLSKVTGRPWPPEETRTSPDDVD